MYYVYVLQSLKNKSKYIGYTSKLPQQRLKEHNAGTNSFTDRNGPYELIYHEEYNDVSFAKKRERFLKSGNGRKVLKRILDVICARSSIG